MPETLEALNSPEEELTEQDQRRIGAITLTLANFQETNKDIVESSFDKARKNGEKLPGKNSERRNYAYLSRLERIINEHGNQLEKRLWAASVNDDLLIDYGNITDSYWESKRKEFRDNGHGDIELTDDLKHEIFEKERDLQKESLEKWATYLGDERSPYPLWFRVYAWNGMTKMGKYDKQKGKYATRNETTVAPYPYPDAEILGGVFEAVNRYHGNSEREFYTEQGERNIDLEKAVQSGNFAKIFTAIQHDIAPVIEPPEKVEDVHGDWIEYLPGEEDNLARSAQGTGWCVASPSVGKNYLEHGNYDVFQEDPDAELKSKFILFHLEDQTTGKLSKNAVASIRLNIDGQVAEISGIKDGQALNDSLVPVVEDKVKTLPGGEKFLPAFRDKQELIRLDRKMQNGEDLTREELAFIYETERPIHTLDTYHTSDPRVKELKKTFDVNYMLKTGISIEELSSSLGQDDIIDNLDALTSHGADINRLVSRFDNDEIVENLDALIGHGANIDVDDIASKASPWVIVENLDSLVNNGAEINTDKLVRKLDAYYVGKNVNTLIDHGIDASRIVSKLKREEYYYDLAQNLDTLNSHGANLDANWLAAKLEGVELSDNLKPLVNNGADVDLIIPNLGAVDIRANLSFLLDHGANTNQLVSFLSPFSIYDNLATLLDHGVNADLILPKIEDYEIVSKLDTLTSHGLDINTRLLPMISSRTISIYLETILEHGANVDLIVSNLDPEDIGIPNTDKLLEHGANVDTIISKLDPDELYLYFDTLRKHGVDTRKFGDTFYDNSFSEPSFKDNSSSEPPFKDNSFSEPPFKESDFSGPSFEEANLI